MRRLRGISECFYKLFFDAGKSVRFSGMSKQINHVVIKRKESINMANRVLSIETGIWWTKVALMEPRKNAFRVVTAFSFRTPEHAIEDGYIRDKEGFDKALKKELKKRSVGERDVVFSINSSRVVTREVLVPAVKDKQIEGIVASQAKEYFPMDISGYTVSYKKLDTVQTEKGKELRLLLVAVPDTLLNNYSSFAKEAGLNAISFDYIGNSAVSLIRKKTSENAVIVQLEEQTTIVSMIADNKILFQRVAPYGYGTALSAALSHAVLGIYDEFEAFDFLTAHDVIHDMPVAAEYASLGSGRENREELLEEAFVDIREALQYHIRVVYTALDYYKNQTQSEFQGRLYLIGDGARFAGMRDLVQAEIPLQLAQTDYQSIVPFVNAKHPDLPKNGDIISFLSVIGTLAEPMDIKPQEMRQQAAKKSNIRTVYLVFAAATLVSVVLVLVSSLRYMLALTEQKVFEARIGQLSYVQQIFDENVAAVNSANAYTAFDRATWTDNERFADLIDQLEKQLPTTASVQDLTVTESNINFNITSDVKLTTAQLLMNLKEIPFLGNLSVPSMSEQTDDAGNTVWQYTLSATYIEPQPETETEEESAE